MKAFVVFSSSPWIYPSSSVLILSCSTSAAFRPLLRFQEKMSRFYFWTSTFLRDGYFAATDHLESSDQHPCMVQAKHKTAGRPTGSSEGRSVGRSMDKWANVARKAAHTAGITQTNMGRSNSVLSSCSS
jgi:hypothetical protein